jgi:hypothetical protein
VRHLHKRSATDAGALPCLLGEQLTFKESHLSRQHCHNCTRARVDSYE